MRRVGWLVVGLIACGRVGFDELSTDGPAPPDTVGRDGLAPPPPDAPPLPDTAPGAEDCFNGVDDDSDGLIDCADADCSPTAVCVPAPSGFVLGTVVDSVTSCPAGYAGVTTDYHRDLVDPGCHGCPCILGEARCQMDVWTYPTAAECAADSGLTGGVLFGSVNDMCPPTPMVDGFVQGVRAGAAVRAQTCTTAGSGTAGPPSWLQNDRFCPASPMGGGCGATSACVARLSPDGQCAITNGDTGCTGSGYGTRQGDLFSGFNDTRFCGACSCTVAGEDCSPVTLGVGSDWACIDSPIVAQNANVCAQIYSPPARVLGLATPGTCEPLSVETGAITPTGQTTVCCHP